MLVQVVVALATSTQVHAVLKTPGDSIIPAMTFSVILGANATSTIVCAEAKIPKIGGLWFPYYLGIGFPIEYTTSKAAYFAFLSVEPVTSNVSLTTGRTDGIDHGDAFNATAWTDDSPLTFNSALSSYSQRSEQLKGCFNAPSSLVPNTVTTYFIDFGVLHDSKPTSMLGPPYQAFSGNLNAPATSSTFVSSQAVVSLVGALSFILLL
ncbi:UNVERIFIED_CONTAM: hypothetical protein HDU68_012361 [Siphonaria sp. JEL0065]|nr:hypothetical protein HDU68_012361 [Siphonaria sp. JEL0065]